MYHLIYFSNVNLMDVYKTPNVTRTYGNNVIVRTGGGRMEGILLHSHGQLKILQKLKDDLVGKRTLNIKLYDILFSSIRHIPKSLKQISSVNAHGTHTHIPEVSEGGSEALSLSITNISCGSLPVMKPRQLFPRKEGTNTTPEHINDVKVFHNICNNLTSSEPLDENSTERHLSSDEDDYYHTDEDDDYVPSDSDISHSKNMMDTSEKEDSSTKGTVITTSKAPLVPYSDSDSELEIEENNSALSCPNDKKCASQPKEKEPENQRDSPLDLDLGGTASKKHCCLYCGNMVIKIARHLENSHPQEPDVINFTSLPPKDSNRLKIIAKIRKMGNFNHNSKLTLLDENKTITCRRPIKNKKNIPKYIPCPECKGFYSKYSLRFHAKSCFKESEPNRNLQRLSRSVLSNRVHPLATEVLKKFVLCRLNEDEIGNIIRQDKLIIIYGNRLCRKYRRHHQQNYQMVRNRLRTIARFLVAIKKIDTNIRSLEEALRLNNVESIIKAVECVAAINTSGTKFESSSTAYQLTNQIKYVITMLAAEHVKNSDSEGANLTNSLYKLLETEFSEGINVTVKETQHEMKRQKKNILPETEDIKSFLDYLKGKIIQNYSLVKQNFSVQNWRNLASYTLVSIQVFNRKRTGEVQNMTMDDFKSYKHVNKSNAGTLFASLTASEKDLVNKYVQVSIRSKRGLRADGTPILLNRLHFNILEDLIKLRVRAGVSEENLYVFGAPGKDNYITLNACDLIRKFSIESEIKNNHLLRGNHLRKHLATSVTLKGYDGITKDRVSDFMAHSKLVHKNFYELPHEVTNITKMSSLLEEAAGTSAYEKNETLQAPLRTIVPQKSNEDFSQENIEQSDMIQSSDQYFSTEKAPDSKLNPLSRNDDEIQGISDEVSEEDPDMVANNHAPKKAWSTPERQIVRNRFKTSLIRGKLPSLKECRMLINEFEVLKHRTPQQIKSWLQHRQVLSTKTMKRRSWSTPEKHAVRRFFQNHFRENSLPSLRECEFLKLKNSELFRDRSCATIKSFYLSDSMRRRLM